MILLAVAFAATGIPLALAGTTSASLPLQVAACVCAAGASVAAWVARRRLG